MAWKALVDALALASMGSRRLQLQLTDLLPSTRIAGRWAHATATGAVLSCRRHSVRALCPMPRCRTSRTKGAGGVVCWPRGKRSEYTGPAGSSAMTRVLVVLLRRSCDCDSKVSNLSGKHRLLS